jgi:outer membrane protein TolC
MGAGLRAGSGALPLLLLLAFLFWPVELYGQSVPASVPGVPGDEPHAAPSLERLSLGLEECIAIALEKNLQIRIATLSKEALEPEVLRARAIFHPVAGASYTATGERPVNDLAAAARVETGTTTGFISQLLPTGGQVILSTNIAEDKTENAPPLVTPDMTLSIVQPLLRNGRDYVTTRPIRDAQSDVLIEEARLKAAILRVIEGTKRSYYRWSLADNTIAVIEAAIERDELLVESSEALLKAGLVTIRDVLSARISLNKDHERLVSARADAESARNNLLDVLGLPFAAAVELRDREIGYIPIPLEPAKWIAAAVKNRPEVLELEEQLAKSALNVRVAGNTLLPQVDFVGSYSRFQTSTGVGRAFALRGDAWSAGLVFSVPLGNVAARSSLSRAQIEHKRLGEQLVRQQRLVEAEVRAAEIKLRNSLNRMEALKKILDHAKKLEEVAKERFARGFATNLDITSAQEDILNAETDILRVMVDYNTGLAELEAALASPLASLR